MPYDAVLDYEGTLFRIEVKGTTTQSLDLTRGGRTGQQTNRNAGSRKRPISRIDCDFVVGVRGQTNDCYIIPAEVVEILAMGNTTGGHSITLNYLEIYFKEKWDLFIGGKLKLSPEEMRAGFRNRTSMERQTFLSQLNVPAPLPNPYKIGKTKKKIVTATDIETLRIWEHLGE